MKTQREIILEKHVGRHDNLDKHMMKTKKITSLRTYEDSKKIILEDM